MRLTSNGIEVLPATDPTVGVRCAAGEPECCSLTIEGAEPAIAAGAAAASAATAVAMA
ncbi:MAG: hypothetical protein ACR2NR_20415 [Solirubrobacteraceae bacterium]